MTKKQKTCRHVRLEKCTYRLHTVVTLSMFSALTEFYNQTSKSWSGFIHTVQRNL